MAYPSSEATCNVPNTNENHVTMASGAVDVALERAGASTATTAFRNAVRSIEAGRCDLALVHCGFKLDNVMFGPGLPPDVVGVSERCVRSATETGVVPGSTAERYDMFVSMATPVTPPTLPAAPNVESASDYTTSPCGVPWKFMWRSSRVSSISPYPASRLKRSMPSQSTNGSDCVVSNMSSDTDSF